MERKTYYDAPTMVRMRDIDNDCEVGGIAYGNEVICGCCGATIPLDDEDSGFEIIEELSWVNFSDYIL